MPTHSHLAHFLLFPRRDRGAGLTHHLRTVIWLLALVSLAACAVNRETADITPGANLSQLKSFYVVKVDADERGINGLIASQLTAMGYAATTGPEADKPKDIDAIVTYRDKWIWDMTMYMLELDVTLRNAQSNYPMAVGNSYHTSLTRKSPEEMVKEVLSNIFNKAKGGTG
jgi:hypothetical protein